MKHKKSKRKKSGFVKAARDIKKKGTEGDFTEWCKKRGFRGVTNECIKMALKAGGRAAKMAKFAKGARTVAKQRKKSGGS